MSHDLTILTFAWVRTQTGEPQFTYATDAETLGQLFDELLATRSSWGALAPRRGEIRCACDQVFASWDTPLAGAREIAFFPPVTGG